MSKGKYILVYGTFVPTEEYQLSLVESEAIFFSERFRSIRSSFPFFKETLEIIKLKLQIFNHSFSEFTSNEGAGLKRQLERTLTKNKQFLGAVLILKVRFVDRKVHYSIQSEKLDYIDYSLNEKGLFIDIWDKIKKPVSPISSLSLGSEIYWKIAKSDPENSAFDEILLVNMENHIVDSVESNIYIINGKIVRGVSMERGGYVDVTKSLMLKIFRNLNLEYNEVEGITENDIRLAEEIMIVNSIDGIRWVVGFGGKRYFNNTIRKINELFGQAKTN